MYDVYEQCPIIENEQYLLRLIEEKDAKDLFAVYSDKNALPFFNSDNCHGDNFYMSKEEYVVEAIKYWKMEYDRRGFVRFTIVDKKENKAIGTIELFRREADDFFTDCGLLRLDLGSKNENKNTIQAILALIDESVLESFHCSFLATKAPNYAVERIEALKESGYSLSKECLVGNDTQYRDYWIKYKEL
ncbi:GNAT family N-acetyltransferase [Anaerosporobacter faecicola]|uniref:GNAT family N-acetyltransferase n=1 Tax=Anaerosporobacter faecicola TaxID=2718714 RepID=UPI0014389284|nr:GNAT family protein [Anaerosporobacter faecicola]